MTEKSEWTVDLEKLRAEYEAWFIGKFGYPPMPIHSRVLDFCWHGYQAGAASRYAEIAELRQQLDMVSEEFCLPKGIGPAPGEIKRILSGLRHELEEARGLMEDCSGWLHADHTEERSLLRKIGEFLK